jgi:hypothetical protein
MAIKYTNIFHCKILQNWPKLGFLGSGNSDSDANTLNKEIVPGLLHR